MKQLAIAIFYFFCACIFLFVGFIWGANSKPGAYIPIAYPTSNDILEKVNEYRVSKGKNPLIINAELCNNLSERVNVYKETKSHEGLEAFHHTWMSQFDWIYELMDYAPTADQTIRDWATSLGHNTTMLEKPVGCIYSAQGYTVMMMTD